MAASSSCSPSLSVFSSARSSARPAFSVSACECTDTYSPAAIDIAPATRPATPATRMLLWVACAAATPSTRLAVETMPASAPSTAARNQPMRPVRCRSMWGTGNFEAFPNDPALTSVPLCLFQKPLPGDRRDLMVRHLVGRFHGGDVLAEAGIPEALFDLVPGFAGAEDQNGPGIADGRDDL